MSTAGLHGIDICYPNRLPIRWKCLQLKERIIQYKQNIISQGNRLHFSANL